MRLLSVLGPEATAVIVAAFIVLLNAALTDSAEGDPRDQFVRGPGYLVITGR